MITKTSILKGEDETLFNLRCADDFYFFRERVLSRHTPQFQKDISEAIFNNRYVNAIVSRQHGKTTLVHDLLKWFSTFHHDKYRDILITSSSLEQQTRKMLDDISYDIKNNEYLSDILPIDNTTSWNKSVIVNRFGCRIGITPYTDSARGSAVDLLVLDDILRDSNISHAEIISIFKQVFFPTVQARKGKIILINTPRATFDLVAELSKDLQFKTLRFPACIEKDGKLVDQLWPEMYSLDELENIRRTMGDLIWKKEYMCTPFSERDALFPYETSILPNIVEEYPRSLPVEGCSYYMGVDVAMASSGTADYAVFTILERGEGDSFQLINLERYKGWSQKELIERIDQLHKTFNFQIVTVEQNGLSFGMVADMLNMPQFKGIVTGFTTNQRNKEEALGRLSYHLRTGLMKLFKDETLIEELRGFAQVEKEHLGIRKTTYECASAHDDCVMSLAIGLQGILISEIDTGVSVEFI